jgi:hypothetical protein
MTADTPSNPDFAAASNRIKIDGVLLLTGIVGSGFLLISWVSAVSVLALLAVGLYFLITANALTWVILALDVIFAVPIWSVTRWTARGLLEGKKIQTLVACILMIGFASIEVIGSILAKKSEFAVAAQGVNFLVALAFSLLLVASFRRPLYWRAR